MQPHIMVLETLRKLGGKSLLQNLLDECRVQDQRMTLQQLLQILMKLEIHGKVRVSSLDEERKIVELVETPS